MTSELSRVRETLRLCDRFTDDNPPFLGAFSQLSGPQGVGRMMIFFSRSQAVLLRTTTNNLACNLVSCVALIRLDASCRGRRSSFARTWFGQRWCTLTPPCYHVIHNCATRPCTRDNRSNEKSIGLLLLQPVNVHSPNAPILWNLLQRLVPATLGKIHERPFSRPIFHNPVNE